MRLWHKETNRTPGGTDGGRRAQPWALPARPAGARSGAPVPSIRSARHAATWLVAAAWLTACGPSSDPVHPASGPQGPVAPVAAGPAGAVEQRVMATTEPSLVLAAEIDRLNAMQLAVFVGSPDPADRRIAARALGRIGGDAAAQEAAQLLRDPDESVRVEACFAVGVTGSPLAAALLSPVMEGNPSAAEMAAIAQGIANCTDDSAAGLLVGLACREDMPVDAPEAIFRHVRWRNRPAGAALPNELMLRYEGHPTARGRAGIGWLGRVWKDARLLDPLVRLAADRDPEVRRAVAMGLANGREAAVRSAGDSERAVAALGRLVRDADARVASAACRGLGTYDREDAVGHLLVALERNAGPTDFNVRVAAAEALGGRKAASAADALANLARKDPSVSVRYAAATQLAEIDAKAAADLIDGLLASPSEYVRSAGVEILAKTEGDAPAARLAKLFADDPHLRVREAALDGLKDRKGPETFAAVKAALTGADPGLAGIATDVAANNGLKELLPEIRAAWQRFQGTPGADAREGIVGALAKFAQPEDDALIRAALDDPDAGPRTAAQMALAARAKEPPPPPDRRPTPTGGKLPGGAPLLANDVDLVIETDVGTMRVRLFTSDAPIHASHVAHLAAQGFYDGLTWHRVVPDFVIQGGCPRGDGAGNAGVNLPLEPTRHPFERGTLGMPRSSHPDTGGCQFFFCHARAPHLDVQYTAFGQVYEGLDVIDRIDVDSKIVRVRVVEAK
ncbi:MAG: HEAT repeat domain-containing protein [Planctomycetes bacterium]|nr:HEAT repeat domain-containing protein [Planctomycetota bacterium]